MINQFLAEMPWEQGDILYSFFGKLQVVVYIGMLFWYCKNYQIEGKKKILIWIMFVIAYFWGNSFCPLLSNLTDGIVPRVNMGVSFLFFIWIIAAISYMLNFPVMLGLDMLIPIFILGRGIAIIGCVFAGCCHGFPTEWGVYSRVAETITFPTVLLDNICSCGISIYLFYLSKKMHYIGNGKVSAIGMVMFGSLRVIIDILRDNPKWIFKFTFEGFCGAFYILFGVLILWRLYNLEKEK